MKRAVWVMVFVFALTSTAILVANSKITMDVIKIDTAKKKSGGQETETVFHHKKHAEEYAKSCDPCHPAIKEEVGAAENTMKLVHDTCKECHNTDKPAKKWDCNTCHTVKGEAAEPAAAAEKSE